MKQFLVCELVNAEMSCILYEHIKFLIGYEYTHSLTQKYKLYWDSFKIIWNN